jgi:Arc/MetJ family transcription regulator
MDARAQKHQRAMSLLGSLLGRFGSWGVTVTVSALLFAWAMFLRLDNQALEGKIERLSTAKEALQVQLAARDTVLSALETSLEDMRDRATRLQQSKKEIRHAPDTDDAAVAPVLSRVFDRLRGE